MIPAISNKLNATNGDGNEGPDEGEMKRRINIIWAYETGGEKKFN
jgi:hypothetical protein